MKRYLNLQGQLFTEAQAQEYYGGRLESAALVAVVVNEDMEVCFEWKHCTDKIGCEEHGCLKDE